MHKTVVIFTILVIIYNGNAFCKDEMKAYKNIETKIAGFTIDHCGERNSIQESKLTEIIGSDCGMENAQKIYFIPRVKAFIDFGFCEDTNGTKWVTDISIMNKQFTNVKSCQVRNKLLMLKTGRGVMLGDSEEKIIKIYGDPYYNGKAEYAGYENKDARQIEYIDVARKSSKGLAQHPFDHEVGDKALRGNDLSLIFILEKGRVVEIFLGFID
jgi:hypothetical protein